MTADRDSVAKVSVDLANELNLCYYAIGTNKELKENKILESGFLLFQDWQRVAVSSDCEKVGHVQRATRVRYVGVSRLRRVRARLFSSDPLVGNDYLTENL